MRPFKPSRSTSIQFGAGACAVASRAARMVALFLLFSRTEITSPTLTIAEGMLHLRPLRSIVLLDAKHLDLKDKRRIAWNLGRAAFAAVGKFSRDDHEPFVARPHQLQYLVPALDHIAAGNPERERVLVVMVLVEHLAVEQFTNVVNHHHVARLQEGPLALILYYVADTRIRYPGLRPLLFDEF